MRFTHTVREAALALAQNRLRSALTALGVIIGVFSVIAIVAVGRGAQAMVADSLRSFGATSLFVVPGNRMQGGVRSASADVNSLTLDDLAAIPRECPAVREVVPFAVTAGTVVSGNHNWPTIVQGTGANALAARDWTLAAGAMFSESDVRRTAKVCVLGRTVAQSVFGDADPVGQTVRVMRVPFRVLGVLSVRGQNGMGQDQDDLVLAPYTAVMKRLSGVTYLHGIQAVARSAEELEPARRELGQLLRRRHHIRAGAPDNFSIVSAGDILAIVEKVYGTLVLFLGTVASITLLVGGIGIMNIMLVSIAERTHEIGLRMALGARSRDVLAQFLVEALALSCGGGAVGVVVGVGLARTVAVVLNWPVLVDAGSTLVAFSLSALIGVVFGSFPAWKASRLEPIDALRAE